MAISLQALAFGNGLLRNLSCQNLNNNFGGFDQKHTGLNTECISPQLSPVPRQAATTGQIIGDRGLMITRFKLYVFSDRFHLPLYFHGFWGKSRTFFSS